MNALGCRLEPTGLHPLQISLRKRCLIDVANCSECFNIYGTSCPIFPTGSVSALYKYNYNMQLSLLKLLRFCCEISLVE